MFATPHFSVTYFGRGQADSLGCVITGLPSKLPLDLEKDIIAQLNSQGYGLTSHVTTIDVVSGLANGAALGSPLTLMARVKREKGDTPKGPRSGTADYYFLMKYGEVPPFHFYRMEEDIKVAAGGVALKWLKCQSKLRIISWVDSVGGLTINPDIRAEMESQNRVVTPQQIEDRGSFLVYEGVTKEKKEEIFVSLGSLKVMDKDGKQHFKFDSFDVEGVSPKEMAILIRHSLSYFKEVNYRETYKVKCPDPEMAFKMIKLIDTLKAQSDSVGGTIGCCIFGIPAGTTGIDSAVAANMFTLHNMKGIEVGRGFEGMKLKLTESAKKEIQPIKEEEKDSELKLQMSQNSQGGIMSGISSTLPFCFRVGFSAPGAIGKKHEIVSTHGTWTTVPADPDYQACDIDRKCELVEGMAAISVIPCLLMGGNLN